jgi:hypothetical protein
VAENRLDAAASLLAERGHDIDPARIAAGRSGVAIGFPEEPLIHVSWLVLAAVAALLLLGRRSR